MKIIAFSLWGDNPKYTIGALKNASLAETVYPGWKCWFYVGTSVPPNIIEDLEKRSNCKVIRMDQEGDWSAMFWRFSPASDPEVEAMISRDTDSRLNNREKSAVEEWLKSDKSFHIMRDNHQHGSPILGGMWGAKFPILKDLEMWMELYNKGNFWQVDQNFLKDVVYPEVWQHSLVHDEFFEKKDFPTGPRDEKHFVGQAYDEKDVPLG